MIKTIVVPVDGSDHARKAADLAGDIGERYEAEIVLVSVALPAGRVPEGLRQMAEAEHLIDPDRRPPAVEGYVPGDTAAALQDSRESDLDEAAATRVAQWILNKAQQRAKERGVTTVRQRLEHGDPAEQILEVAKEEKADLIVIGSRGLSPLAGLLLGSVSHKICQLSECSCITVK